MVELLFVSFLKRLKITGLIVRVFLRRFEVDSALVGVDWLAGGVTFDSLFDRRWIFKKDF